MAKLTEKECADGSHTFHNEEVGESYHTPLGAAMEAREKYVPPCEVKKRCKGGPINVLDVCYGLGYNTAALIEAAKKNSPDCDLTVYGLELDKDIVERSLDLPFPFAHEDLFKRLNRNYDERKRAFTMKGGRTTITVLIGDAKERLNEVPFLADVVLFDPFSPRKAPEMWTEEFFKDIYEKCAEGAVLVTYSCARAAREVMAAAGFKVEDGPVVGRRGPATVGRVSKDT
ncbi:MAG: tRNA (5-methylaminomethyl-2-thiouridine)(34)-methyltransferase MnmD [Candidatus Woesearchaeota archaeon]